MNTKKNLRVWGGVAVMVGGLLGTGWAQQETPVAMAPPVATSADDSQDSVFHWQEIPEGQQVALARASFDKAGYQLYDTMGETIIVPFVNDNLYVMKFARATGSTLYFVNDGGQPTLYVPDNGYLENATSEGSRWYPFSKGFTPDQPVYMGLAPSYADYASMGWYPGMSTWGGYYSTLPYGVGTTFFASPGLYFQIGNQPYYGWGGYYSYYSTHPRFSSIGVYRPSYYRPRGTLRPYAFGNSTYYAHRPYSGIRGQGNGRPSNGYGNGKLLNGILPSNTVTSRPSYNRDNRNNGDNRGNWSDRDNRNSRDYSGNPDRRYNSTTIINRDIRIFRGGTTTSPTNGLPLNRPGSNGFPSGSSFRGNTNGNTGSQPFRGNMGNQNSTGNAPRPSYSRPSGGGYSPPSGGTFRSPTSGGNRGGGGSGRRGR